MHRLTGTFLFHELLHFFTHIEEGFLATSWHFIVRPGRISMNYLKGKRKRYQPPVSYFFIWTGIYLLVHNFIINYFHYHIANVTGLTIREQGNELFRTHFILFFVPLLLVETFIIYAVLSKPRFNFVEMLILGLYAAGTYFMMLLISDIILGLIFRVNVITNTVFLWQTILSTIYNFWICFDFFKLLHLRFLKLRLFGSAIIVAFIGWGLMELLPMAWIYFTK